MPKYRISANDKSGKQTTLTCEADNPEEAVSFAEQQGFVVNKVFMTDSSTTGQAEVLNSQYNTPDVKGDRKCESCFESIPLQAKKCPRCQQWRKDIQEDRTKSYMWLGTSFLPTLLLVVGIISGWWNEYWQVNYFNYRKFSIAKLLTSPSGLLVIYGEASTFYMYLKFVSRVNKKVNG